MSAAELSTQPIENTVQNDNVTDVTDAVLTNNSPLEEGQQQQQQQTESTGFSNDDQKSNSSKIQLIDPPPLPKSKSIPFQSATQLEKSNPQLANQTSSGQGSQKNLLTMSKSKSLSMNQLSQVKATSTGSNKKGLNGSGQVASTGIESKVNSQNNLKKSSNSIHNLNGNTHRPGSEQSQKQSQKSNASLNNTVRPQHEEGDERKEREGNQEQDQPQQQQQQEITNQVESSNDTETQSNQQGTQEEINTSPENDPSEQKIGSSHPSLRQAATKKSNQSLKTGLTASKSTQSLRQQQISKSHESLSQQQQMKNNPTSVSGSKKSINRSISLQQLKKSNASFGSRQQLKQQQQEEEQKTDFSDQKTDAQPNLSASKSSFADLGSTKKSTQSLSRQLNQSQQSLRQQVRAEEAAVESAAVAASHSKLAQEVEGTNEQPVESQEEQAFDNTKLENPTTEKKSTHSLAKTSENKSHSSLRQPITSEQNQEQDQNIKSQSIEQLKRSTQSITQQQSMSIRKSTQSLAKQQLNNKSQQSLRRVLDQEPEQGADQQEGVAENAVSSSSVAEKMGSHSSFSGAIKKSNQSLAKELKKSQQSMKEKTKSQQSIQQSVTKSQHSIVGQVEETEPIQNVEPTPQEEENHHSEINAPEEEAQTQQFDEEKKETQENDQQSSQIMVNDQALDQNESEWTNPDNQDRVVEQTISQPAFITEFHDDGDEAQNEQGEGNPLRPKIIQDGNDDTDYFDAQRKVSENDSHQNSNMLLMAISNPADYLKKSRETLFATQKSTTFGEHENNAEESIAVFHPEQHRSSVSSVDSHRLEILETLPSPGRAKVYELPHHYHPSQIQEEPESRSGSLQMLAEPSSQVEGQHIEQQDSRSKITKSGDSEKAGSGSNKKVASSSPPSNSNHTSGGSTNRKYSTSVGGVSQGGRSSGGVSGLNEHELQYQLQQQLQLQQQHTKRAAVEKKELDPVIDPSHMIMKPKHLPKKATLRPKSSVANRPVIPVVKKGNSTTASTTSTTVSSKKGASNISKETSTNKGEEYMKEGTDSENIASNKKSCHPRKSVDHTSIITALRQEINSLKVELGDEHQLLEQLKNHEKQLMQELEEIKNNVKEISSQNARLLLNHQKKAYTILIARFRAEIRRLKFQRNSLFDPVLELKYFPHLPITNFGNTPRNPPVGIIGNTAHRSTDYFLLNPPPCAGTHPDGGYRWWWGEQKETAGKQPNGPVENEEQKQFKVGQRVAVYVEDEKCFGVIKYLGAFDAAPDSGLWAGIKLDRPVGRHDGVVKGKRYFKCEENHGFFSKISKLRPVHG